jgi:hypothetical protein
MTDPVAYAVEAEIARLKSKAAHILTLIQGGRVYGTQKRSASLRRDEYLKEAARLSLSLAEIKEAKQNNATRDDIALAELSRDVASLKAEVAALLDKYMKFAEDHTRVSSMRVMAAQFANELTKLTNRKSEP